MCSDILYGRPASFAQAWQDWYLFHNIFPDRLEWGGGFYVEIGVWNPIMTSNTLFFDKCLGWSGVCFEPNENWWPAIQRERSCKLVRNCVWARPRKSNSAWHTHKMAVQVFSVLMHKMQSRNERKPRRCNVLLLTMLFVNSD